MIPWTKMERRWRDAIMAAMIPPLRGGRLPGLSELDTTDFWGRLHQVAPPLMRLGLRVGVWLLTFSPLFLIRRFRRFPSLPPGDQDRVLVRADGHRCYVVRQVTLTVKILACFAYFQKDVVRDGVDADRGGETVRRLRTELEEGSPS